MLSLSLLPGQISPIRTGSALLHDSLRSRSHHLFFLYGWTEPWSDEVCVGWSDCSLRRQAETKQPDSGPLEGGGLRLLSSEFWSSISLVWTAPRTGNAGFYASLPALVTDGKVSKLWPTKWVAGDKHGVTTNIEAFCQCSLSSEPAVS